MSNLTIRHERRLQWSSCWTWTTRMRLSQCFQDWKIRWV